MSAHVDQLIDRQNAEIDAPRPRFAVECVRFSESFAIAIPGPVQYRVWFDIPGYANRTVTFASSTEAMTALNGALWCGASHATIDYQTGAVWTQEVFVAREGGL